jgi:hypothetical protein
VSDIEFSTLILFTPLIVGWIGFGVVIWCDRRRERSERSELEAKLTRYLDD